MSNKMPIESAPSEFPKEWWWKFGKFICTVLYKICTAIISRHFQYEKCQWCFYILKRLISYRCQNCKVELSWACMNIAIQFFLNLYGVIFKLCFSTQGCLYHVWMTTDLVKLLPCYNEKWKCLNKSRSH